MRQHWKGVWENCRLTTAERELLGVVRVNDLPGSEAPAAWLTYLRGGSALNTQTSVSSQRAGLEELGRRTADMARLAATPA